MNNLSKFKKLNRNYLTFYHECLIPENYFFKSNKNQDSNSKLLFISSPSRMGNHALLSMLDNHPQLPRIPGEDSFLRHSFFLSTYSLHDYLKNIKSENNTDFIRKLSSFPANIDKWFKFKECYENNIYPKVHAGIQYPTNKLVITDYQDTLFDINYDCYKSFIEKNKKNISKSDNFKDILLIYLKSFLKLDPLNFKIKTNYDGYYINSGMRRQLLWVCQNFKNVKIITSIRKFDTYCVSFIKAKCKKLELTKENILEAWEQWFHKIIDYFFIKSIYPEKIFLVPFEDIYENTEYLAKMLAEYLNIDFHEVMLTATIFGNEVRGNSSEKKNKNKTGKFYKSNQSIPKEFIPETFFHLWDSFELIKYKNWKD